MPWSLSQYNLYRKCPTAYKFRHVDRLADPAGPAAQRGTNTHAILENYLESGDWGGLIPPFTKAKAEAMRSEGYKAELKLALDNQWAPVDWKSPDAWVRCVIDSFHLGDVKIRMGEWKTGKVWDDHVSQRRLYLTMVLSAHPQIVEAEIETIYVDQHHAVQDVLHRINLEAEQQKWRENVEPMQQDTFFSPRPGQHCRWCAFSKTKGGPCQY